MAAGIAGCVVGVRALGGFPRQALVAAGAQGISLWSFELHQRALLVFRVGVMAVHAAQLTIASAELKIPRLTRVDAAAPGSVPTRLPFPGVRVARKEHRVTLGARAIDVLRVAGLC